MANDIRILHLVDGIQYSGGGCWVVFGVLYDEKKNDQRFFGTSVWGTEGFEGIYTFTDYPYLMDGDCFPSFLPKEDYAELVDELITMDSDDFYTIWNGILEYLRAHGMEHSGYVHDWQTALDNMEKESGKLSREDAEKVLSDYVSDFPGVQGIVLYNKFLSEIGAFNHRFYDLNESDFQQMLRDNSMSALDVAMFTDREFNRNHDYCYIDGDGWIHSTDYPETICDWDGFMQYVLDEGHNLGDNYIAEILANANWR